MTASPLVRRVLLLGQPLEARVFAFIGSFAAVIAVAYWVLTYETAGTVLLAGFALAAGVTAALLIRASSGFGSRVPGTGAPEPDADRAFADASGRLPGESLAPMALALGLALALTAVVFGPWLAVAGILPTVWGAWSWLAGATAELDALAHDSAGRDEED